jgi:hypothetical protein
MTRSLFLLSFISKSNLFRKSLNIVESPHLRRIFMLLRKDLKDSDIPHRTAIRTQIKEIWDEYLNGLEDDLKVYIMMSTLSLLIFINRTHSEKSH